MFHPQLGWVVGSIRLVSIDLTTMCVTMSLVEYPSGTRFAKSSKKPIDTAVWPLDELGVDEAIFQGVRGPPRGPPGALNKEVLHDPDFSGVLSAL